MSEPMLVDVLFTCGYCEQNSATFCAVDDVPTHAHLCAGCFHALCEDSPPGGLQDHYIEVKLRPNEENL